MPIINDTTLNSGFLIGDPGQGGSPPVATEVNGVPIAAALEIQSTEGALVLPRMNDTEMNDLVPAVDGMMIYNTTHTAVYFRQGGVWIPESGSGGGSVTSITQGANIVLSPSPIVTTGSVSLNPVLTGLTSAAIGTFSIATNIISSSSSNVNILATAPVSNLNLISSTEIYLNTGTAGSGNVNITNGSRLLIFNNASSRFIGLRADPTLASSASYILPSTLPASNGQVMACTTGGTMSWVNLGSGSVTSITAGSNLSASPNPIIATGTISLSNTPSGLTSIGVGNLTLATTAITSSGALTLTATSNPASIVGSLITLNSASDVNCVRDFVIQGGNDIRFNNIGDTQSVAFKAGTLSASTSYTLPTAYPVSNGQVLAATTAGVMTWSTAAGSVTSITQAANIVCTPNPITGAGTVGLNPVMTGLTSAAFTGNFSMAPTGSDFLLQTTSTTRLFLQSASLIGLDAVSGIYLGTGTTHIAFDSGTGGSQFLSWENSTGRSFAIRAPAGSFTSAAFDWPAAAPTPGQILQAGAISGGIYPLSWATAGSGTVTSVAATGPNLTGGTITTTGSIGLSPTLALTSAAFSTLTLSSTGLNNSNVAANIALTVGANTPFIVSQNQVTVTQNLFIETGKALAFLSTDGTKDTLFTISPSQSATTVTYTLPVAGPTVSGQVLAATTAGVMSWAANSGVNAAAKFILQQADGTMTNAQAMGALTTGLVKNTTTTGVQSIAVAGTDYYAPGATYAVEVQNVGGTPNADIFMANTSNSPTVPTGGGVLYVQAGQLKYIGTNGTVTTIAPA